MKNKITVFMFIISLALIAVTCGKIDSTKNDETKKKSLNPNGDSELAIVMRTMMQSGKTMKSEIENNKTISQYPSEIKTIVTAKPTDGMIDDREVFNVFANFYLTSLDSVYIPNIDVKTQFNHVVKSCVDCHQNYCHGPIPAIKQLYIPAK